MLIEKEYISYTLKKTTDNNQSSASYFFISNMFEFSKSKKKSYLEIIFLKNVT